MTPDTLAVSRATTLKTLRDLFYIGLRRGRAFGRLLYPSGGSYHALSADEIKQRVERCASALEACSIRKGDRVAILSYNRPEWAVVDYASQLVGAVTVPIYTTLPADQVEFILEDSGCKIVFVENGEHLRKISSKRPVIAFEHEERSESLKAFLARGTGGRPSPRLDPSDLATIIYTSGTTGTPKGVMLSHQNLVSNAEAVLKAVEFTPEDISLSFLPLSHSFQRLVDYALFLQGSVIAYAESIDAVADNLLDVEPTLLCAVPRFYEKVHDRVLQAVDAMPARRRALARWALAAGAEEANARRAGQRPPFGVRWRSALADRLVLRKIRRRTGGRLRLLISGGAPLGRATAEFFWALGFTLLEGYGLTETSPVVAVNRVGRTKLGSVGLPIEGVEVRIADVDGEVLVRGPNVMRGYFNRAPETETVLRDGWFHTGDIGQLDSDGYLYITDRKKDLLKTSGGKYIAPGPIEDRLRRHPLVANALVLGNGRRYAAALIVPDFSVLESRFPGMDRAALAAHPPVLQEIQKHVDAVNAALAPFETIKKFALLEQDFSVEGGELTPTLKVKRRSVEERYRDVIETLFV